MAHTDPVAHKASLIDTQNFLNGNKGVTMVSLNARSLNRKKRTDVKLSLDCDILCCCESWALEGTDDTLFHWGNKRIFRNDRPGKTGGGLLTYVGEFFGPYCHSDPTLELMEANIEVQALVFEKPTYRNFIVLNVYRPPNLEHEDFFDKLEVIIGRIDRDKYELWVMGDMNANTRERNSAPAKGLFDLCRETSVKRLIESITRPNENNLQGGTCIDHILSDCDIVSSSGVLDCLISDHYPIFACRKKGKEVRTPATFTGRSYRAYDRDDFLEYLSNLDLTEFHSMVDPDQQWQIIYDAIIAYLDICCPVKTFNIKKQSDPWVTPETVELINDRSSMLKEYRVTGEPQLIRQVRRLKNRIQRQLENAEGDYVITTLERAEGDPSRFWREVNKLVNPVTKNLIIKLTNEITGEVVPVEETAAYINNYFANIGKNLYDQLPTLHGLPRAAPVADNAVIDDDEELDLSESINHEIVLGLIKKINVDKSCGLMESTPEFSKTLCYSCTGK